MKFDMDVIKAHGLETITPVVLTNTDDLRSVSLVKSGKVTEKDVIISFEKKGGKQNEIIQLHNYR